MRTKSILLGSVSAIATAAAGAGHVQAATAASNNGYTYSVQGGLALTPAELSLASDYQGLSGFNSGFGSFTDKFGTGYSSGFASIDDLDQAFGYNAAVTIGKDLGNGWDMRFGATVNATGESSGYTSGYAFGSGFSYSGSYPTGSSAYGSASVYRFVSETEKFSFQALDFEVGYTPVLTDTLSVRLFGGIRAVHSLYEIGRSNGSGFNVNQSGYSAGGYASGIPNLLGFGGNSGYSGASGWYDKHLLTSGITSQTTKTSFFGAGPRMGIDVSKRFEGTNFGLSARFAGSVLFGTETTSYSGVHAHSAYYSGAEGYYSGSDLTATSSYTSGSTYYTTFSGSDSVGKKIADVEAQVGFDYYLDDTTALTIGYQAEKFIDLDDSEGGVDHLTHGAFVKLTGSF